MVPALSALAAARARSMVGASMRWLARHAKRPPTTPPSVPPPAMRPMERRAVWGSKRSLTSDQKAEMRVAPKTAMCR
ncbi:hypothetical protein BE15_12700 [Sorangium cellulosum]|uniref:Uncharacterized protein n=1 Tax=Sorangium cellulosum TaxID=56 RepID=A0A150Q1N8_SORCE|nr:hypothetical protein BE15_12700 [Sorangium cellulosum]